MKQKISPLTYRTKSLLSFWGMEKKTLKYALFQKEPEPAFRPTVFEQYYDWKCM